VKNRCSSAYGVLALVLVAFLPGCSRGNPEVAKRKYLASGNSYFEQKKYQEAIIEYRNAVQQDARFGEARLRLAEAYVQIGDKPNALREYVRAADLLPNDAKAQLTAGGLLLDAGHYDDAKGRAEKVLEGDPKSVEAHILLGNALARLRDFESAVKQLQEAIDLAQRRTNLTDTGYRRRVAELENRLVAWVLAKPSGCSDDLRRLHQHLCNHITEWFVFLHEPEVPPTNNHAERMLRPAVITRKVGGCNKTLLGSLVHSVLASIMVTCKQQGRRFLELAKRLWQGGEPQAIPLVPEPDS